MDKDLEMQAMKAYLIHKQVFENWTFGKPVDAWLDDNSDLCVKYADGTWFHYRDLDTKAPEWW